MNRSYMRAGRHALVRETPSVNFFEGALLGNGGMGAVVCVRPDAVMIHFGHNNVWDVRLAENNRESIGTFKEIFAKVKAIPETHELLADDPWYGECGWGSGRCAFRSHPACARCRDACRFAAL